ncbi:uncharacterized protein LOC120635300 [Pararge aegeria]|nr:uncharacterized protein LOC120635300 [Pararge aegeria]
MYKPVLWLYLLALVRVSRCKAEVDQNTLDYVFGTPPPLASDSLPTNEIPSVSTNKQPLRPVMLRRRKYPPPMVGGFKVDYYTFPYQEYINLVVNGAGVIDLR